MIKAKVAIGQSIKKWREFKNIKQETLALELSISKAALSHIENGKTDVTITRIKQIADVLEINLLQLLSTPQQLMNIENNTIRQSEKVDDTQHFLVNVEVLKMLREELQIKNKQLDQLMLALNKFNGK